jgi:uncharacterized membrane protein YidH (DUF202 family)
MTTKTDNEAFVSQRSAAWNAGINLVVPVLALSLFGTARVARHAPLGVLAGTGVLIGCGFCLFALAKASLLREERWVSFGTAHMTRRHRIGYRIGYALMIAGTVVTAGFLIAWP